MLMLGLSLEELGIFVNTLTGCDHFQIKGNLTINLHMVVHMCYFRCIWYLAYSATTARRNYAKTRETTL